MGRFRKESRSPSGQVDSAIIEAKFSTVLGIVGGLGTALVVYFGARQVLSGALSWATLPSRGLPRLLSRPCGP